MSDIKDSWLAAFSERSDLTEYGSAGLALFAMALKFGYDDLATIGVDAVVDGPDDKGCDVVYIDRDQRLAIVAQSYFAETPKASARDSKAATLRQGLSYLLEVPIDGIPERLRSSASALRSAIADGGIDEVYAWFVHNCPGSQNVEREVETVGLSATSMIRTHFGVNDIRVLAEEISADAMERLYTETSTPILVNDTITFDAPSGFSFNEGEWSCFVTPMPLSALKLLYEKYKTDLFSANVRDFLGMKTGDSNINYQMQKSLKERPSNFFVYNNGLTILTHRIQPPVDGSKTVTIKGISIVNGAQTTGTIGTSGDNPSEKAYVLARFISTTSEDLVGDVVRYNNSQNAVTASDFRSTDPTQRRLVDEMKSIPDAEYDGGRRGGVSAAIKRRPKLLPSYSVGQAIAAVHGDATVAYNEKSAIWSRDSLYTRYFNDFLTAKHIVFCYGLLKAIENEKNQLRTKDANDSTSLTSAEKDKLEFYRRRGSAFLLLSAIAECFETITERVIGSRFSLSFGESVSPDQAASVWASSVSALSSLHTHLNGAFSDGLKNQERVRETNRAFSQLVASLKLPYEPFFKEVRDHIKTSG